MSGALCALASMGTVAPDPLVGSVSLVGGVSFNVTGSSGNIYSQGGAVIGVAFGGGTPPISANTNLTVDARSNGSNSISIAAAGDGVHNTVAFSGMNVGDTILFHIDWSASDSGSPQQSLGGRRPDEGQSYSIHRVS